MVILIAVSGIAGYYVGYNTGYGAGVAQVRATEPVKIGIMVPLSPPGDYKSGQIQLDAYRMGFEWVNEHGGVLGGRQLIMIGPYDDQGKPEIGVTMTKRLITEDGVVGIVAGWHSSVGLAQAKVANELKTPIINPASWTDEIPKLHSNYVFKIAVFNTEITMLMMPFLKAKGYKRIVFLGEDTDYGIDQGNSVETFLKSEGVSYEYFEKIMFPYEAVDFRPYLLKIKAMTPPPDAMIFAAVYQSMYLIPKQAKELGLYDMMDIIVGWDYPAWSPDWWEVAGDSGVGPIFPALFHPSLLTESGKEFQSAFRDA
jgi:branched-chain amino acid transport system substrate-binding protein